MQMRQVYYGIYEPNCSVHDNVYIYIYINNHIGVTSGQAHCTISKYLATSIAHSRTITQNVIIIPERYAKKKALPIWNCIHHSTCRGIDNF